MIDRVAVMYEGYCVIQEKHSKKFLYPNSVFIIVRKNVNSACGFLGTTAMKYKSLISPLSVLVFVFGIGMLLCAITDWVYSSDAWPIFTLSGLIVGILGGTFSIFADHKPGKNLIGSQEAYFLLAIVWVIFPLISALPFLGLGFSFTDSIFESVSGLTTTGATIITGLDSASTGLLLWRAILQWIGGLAIVVTTVIVLPFLGSGGMEVFSSFSPESSGKFTKNSRKVANHLIGIYFALSILCCLLYWSNGMSFFDAVAHAMTTVSAGGFSTSDASFLQQNNQILIIATVFMILVGLPFLFFKPYSKLLIDLFPDIDFDRFIKSKSQLLWSTIVRTKNSAERNNPSEPSDVRSNTETVKNSKQEEKAQVRQSRMSFSRSINSFMKDSLEQISNSQIIVYLLIIFTSIVVVTFFGSFQDLFDADLPQRITHSAFNVASIITGTGYVSADYDVWGSGVTAWFIVLMFCGGCAGSAACGIRIFRLQIAASAVNSYCKKMLSPHRVSHIYFNRKPVKPATQQAVLVLIFLYISTFLVSASLLAISGLDPVTSISAAAASVSNVGPGFGDIVGPTGTFQPLSDMEKWICLITMLLGRIEFLTFFVVLTPRFWTT